MMNRINKKAFCLIISFVFCAFSLLMAQSVDYIRNSGEYYFGTGTGSNNSDARKNALSELSESISLNIQSAFEQIVIETGEDVKTYTETVLRSYSNDLASLSEQKLIRKKPGDVKVMIYISGKDLQEVFRQRQQMIRDFIVLGAVAEEQLRINDALRYFYWALVLARSHPENTQLRYYSGNNTDAPLILSLNNMINNIFSGLRAEIISVEERKNPPQKSISLRFYYRDLLVQDIDYVYWLGEGYSAWHSASNGMGFALLEGFAATGSDRLYLWIEYQYANRASLKHEVEIMIQNVNPPYFINAGMRIDFSEIIADEQHIGRQSSFPIIHSSVNEYLAYKTAVEQVVDAIRNQQYRQVQNLFTPSGYELYKRLVTNSKISVLDNHVDTLSIVQVGSEVMVRSVPMMFAFHNNRERLIKNIVFTFDLDGMITGLTYALSNNTIKDILSKPAAFGSKEEKILLIKIIEDYKSAVALQRIAYIEDIFYKNAQDLFVSESSTEMQFINLWKSEYISGLKQIYKRNEYINIRFDNIQIRRARNNNKIYGIQLSKCYYSDSYANKGFLFVMIDIDDILNPITYICIWQPEKKPDGSIYGLEDFMF